MFLTLLQILCFRTTANFVYSAFPIILLWIDFQRKIINVFCFKSLILFVADRQILSVRCSTNKMNLTVYPNLDKPEPKFCHFAQEIVGKCLT